MDLFLVFCAHKKMSHTYISAEKQHCIQAGEKSSPYVIYSMYGAFVFNGSSSPTDDISQCI